MAPGVANLLTIFNANGGKVHAHSALAGRNSDSSHHPDHVAAMTGEVPVPTGTLTFRGDRTEGPLIV